MQIICLQFPTLHVYVCIFFKIDILIFERSKGTERKKNYQPRIKPVSQQNKFESGGFSALSTCANEAVEVICVI